MHTNTGRQTRQKLREPLQRVQWLYFFILGLWKEHVVAWSSMKTKMTTGDGLQLKHWTATSRVCVEIILQRMRYKNKDCYPILGCTCDDVKAQHKLHGTALIFNITCCFRCLVF